MPQVVLNIRHLPGFSERRPIVPPGAVYIGRTVSRMGLSGSKWGNPFKPSIQGDAAAHAVVVTLYRRWLCGHPKLLAALPELRGRDLVCWCAPLPCHGDVLLGHSSSAVPGAAWKCGRGGIVTEPETREEVAHEGAPNQEHDKDLAIVIGRIIGTAFGRVFGTVIGIGVLVPSIVGFFALAGYIEKHITGYGTIGATLLTALVFGIVQALLLALLMRRSGYGGPSSISIPTILSRIVLCVYCTAVLTLGAWETYFFVIPFIKTTIIPSIVKWSGTTESYTLTSAAIVALACIIYRMRCRNRLFYGLLEVAFGVINITYFARDFVYSIISGTVIHSDIETLINNPNNIQFVGGVYIIIRGLANIEDGVKKTSQNLDALPRFWAGLFYGETPPGRWLARWFDKFDRFTSEPD